MAEDKAASGPALALLDSLRSLAASLVAAVETRLEILSTEIEEERGRLERLFLLGVLFLFCLGLGIVLLAMLLVLLFWDSRLALLGVLAGLFLGAALILGWVLRRQAKEKRRLFETTLSELAKDEDLLKSGP